VVELEVKKLLNGVDIEGSRLREREMKALTLFYSYSHKDETLRNELETHLKLLQRQNLISTWLDRKITAGAEWAGQIDRNHQTAEIILLLVSADFIASAYCYDKEMKRALERHEAGRARVIPVIMRDVDWQSAPFSKLQALPKEWEARHLVGEQGFRMEGRGSWDSESRGRNKGIIVWASGGRLAQYLRWSVNCFCGVF
jgi:internalin A